jgi:hypothetical protein
MRTPIYPAGSRTAGMPGKAAATLMQSPARGPPTDSRELVQAHDDRDAIQASPDELSAIDIRSL